MNFLTWKEKYYERQGSLFFNLNNCKESILSHRLQLLPPSQDMLEELGIRELKDETIDEEIAVVNPTHVIRNSCQTLLWRTTQEQEKLQKKLGHLCMKCTIFGQIVNFTPYGNILQHSLKSVNFFFKSPCLLYLLFTIKVSLVNNSAWAGKLN